MVESWVPAVIGTGGALAGSLLTFAVTRRTTLRDALAKNLTEAQGQVFEALRGALTVAREEAEKLNGELEEMRRANTDCQESNLELRRRVRSLERRLKAMGPPLDGDE